MLLLNFTPFPVLTTGRLILRQLKKEDDNDIFALRSDDLVNKFIDREKAVSIEDAQAFINMINNNIANHKSIYWAIVLKNEERLAGTICYWNISPENSLAEIGYELHPAFQGQGIMQEALTKVIDFGFEQMKIETITACTHVTNKKSAALLESKNFRIDTKRTKELPAPVSDSVIYSLSKPSGR